MATRIGMMIVLLVLVSAAQAKPAKPKVAKLRCEVVAGNVIRPLEMNYFEEESKIRCRATLAVPGVERIPVPISMAVRQIGDDAGEGDQMRSVGRVDATVEVDGPKVDVELAIPTGELTLYECAPFEVVFEVSGGKKTAKGKELIECD